jgi:hypothetical protein
MTAVNANEKPRLRLPRASHLVNDGGSIIYKLTVAVQSATSVSMPAADTIYIVAIVACAQSISQPKEWETKAESKPIVVVMMMPMSMPPVPFALPPIANLDHREIRRIAGHTRIERHREKMGPEDPAAAESAEVKRRA